MAIENLVNSILQALAGSEPESTTGSSNGTQSIGGVEVDTTNNAVVPIVKPKKKLVVIERIIQEEDIPAQQTGIDLENTVKDVCLKDEDKAGAQVKKANGRHIYTVRSEDKCKKADHIFLHYTAGTPTGIGDLDLHINGARTASSHFYIFRNARIVQAFDFDKKTYTQHGDDARSPENRFYTSGRYLGPDANDFSYSLECASTEKQKGEMEIQQTKAISYALRYIKKRAHERFGTYITLNRIWRGYPELDDTTIQDNDQSRIFDDVFGNLIGHIETYATSCPGAKFPWIDILTKLGSYPTSTEEKNAMRTKIAEFYTKFDAMTDEGKKNLSNFSKSYNGVIASDIGEMAKQHYLPYDRVPYYYNASHWDDNIEYVVWYRTSDDVLDEEKYNVGASTFNPATQMPGLSLRDEFIQSILDGGEPKYPPGSYEVIA